MMLLEPRTCECREVVYEELRVVKGVKAALSKAATKPAALKEYWGNYLFHIEDLPFPAKDCPMVFTQFRKSVESKSRVRKVCLFFFVKEQKIPWVEMR